MVKRHEMWIAVTKYVKKVTMKTVTLLCDQRKLASGSYFSPSHSLCGILHLTKNAQSITFLANAYFESALQY